MRKYAPILMGAIMDERLSDSEFRLLSKLIAKYGNKEFELNNEALSKLATSKRTFYRLSDKLVECQYLQHVTNTSRYSVPMSILATNNAKYGTDECQKWQNECQSWHSENEEERSKEEDKEYIYNTALSNSNSLKVKENEKEKEIQKKEKDGQAKSKRSVSTFVKPTVEEIHAYCKERHSTVSAQAFFDWYEANGWMVGRNHMKDFKAAVRTWEQKDRMKGITYIPPENREEEESFGDCPF